MRLSLAALLATCLTLPAFAGEEGAVRPDGRAEGPGAMRPAARPLPDPLATYGPPERAPLMNLRSGAGCSTGELEVCLDTSGRISVPGASRFLPAFPGLKPERLTIKRNGVVFRYSF